MKGYRTIIYNTIAGALTVLVGVNWPEVLTAVPWAAPVVIVVLNFALRYVTTTAIGVKA